MRPKDLSFTTLRDYKVKATVEVIVEAEGSAEADLIAFNYLNQHCESVDIGDVSLLKKIKVGDE